MATTYLFFKPAQLPLLAAEMNEGSLLSLDAVEVGERLREAFPALQWQSPTEASGEIAPGWVEFHLLPETEGGALAMRCSLRADYAPAVQALCDRFAWVAFEETAICYQPHQAPMAV